MKKDKKKNNDSILSIPILKIKVADNPQLHFKAFELVKVHLIAECHNMTIPKQGLKYKWFYSDSTGYEKVFLTDKGMIMLRCPNFFCGRTITIKVEIVDPYKFTYKIDFYHLNEKKIDFIEPLADTIQLYPMCKKGLVNNSIWEPNTPDMPNWVTNSIDISGYNGEEIGIRQFILDKKQVVWQKCEKRYVNDNCIQTEFGRENCPSDVTKDKTYTLLHQIIDTKNGNLLKEYSKTYTVKQFQTTEAIYGFPLQPVVVGNVEIQENNYMPCKYTQIDVEYSKDKSDSNKSKVTVFKEGKLCSKDINIIGGTREITATLLEYTPNKCELKSQSHKEKRATLILYNKDEREPQITTSNQVGKVKFELEYMYSLLEKIAILKYIWPIREELIQTNKLSLTTCRHSNVINLNMYSDIKWNLAFAISLENPLAYTHSGKKENKKALLIYKEAQTKASKSGLDKTASFRGEAIPFEFNLSLEASFETKHRETKLEIAKDFIENIKRFISIVAKLKEWADKIKNIAGGTVKANPILSLNSPFSIEIMSPKLAANIGWALEYDETTHNVTTIGNLSFAADPLIGAEFTIDLIAATTTAINPVVSKIVNGFRIGLEKLGAHAIIELVFYGNLEIVMDALKFNTATKLITGGKDQMIKGAMGVKLRIDIEIKGELTGFVCTVEYKFAAEAQAEAYFGGTMKFGTDNQGLYTDFTGEFSGLLLTAKLKGKIGLFSGSVEFKADPILKSSEKKLGKLYII